MPMGMFMRASGSTIKLTGKEHTFIWTEQDILVTGKKTNSMAMVSRPGQMGQDTKGSIFWAKNTVMELSNGLMDQCISDNSTITIFMEQEYTHGAMEGNTKVNGEVIRCMVGAPSPGQMDECMLENMSRTRSKDTENSSGLMVVHTKEIGSMESSMVKVST
jgi:archaellum component FlaG (FlaF/FlaG flagellin family)